MNETKSEKEKKEASADIRTYQVLPKQEEDSPVVSLKDLRAAERDQVREYRGKLAELAKEEPGTKKIMEELFPDTSPVVYAKGVWQEELAAR